MYAQQETLGHIEGMLDRDIRTTRTVCTKCARDQNQCDSGPALAECRNVCVSHVFPRNNKRFQQRNSYAWNSLQRFKHILIFGVYLLSISNVPRAQSRPVKIMDREWWIMSTEKNDTGDNVSTSICPFVSNMCHQSNNAKFYGAVFQTKYSLDEHISFSDKFFPDVNPENKASDEIDGAQFNDVELNEFVKKIYQYLQKAAVGLDAMYKNYGSATDDGKAATENNLKDELEQQMLHLRSLLFEIYDYISAFKITPYDDVRRADFPLEYTSDMGVTKYKILSRLCVQGYVKTLHYVHAGLSHYNQTDCI